MTEEYWALLRKDGSVFKKHRRKYDLLKLTVEEPVSKRNISTYTNGDIFTVLKEKNVYIDGVKKLERTPHAYVLKKMTVHTVFS